MCLFAIDSFSVLSSLCTQTKVVCLNCTSTVHACNIHVRLARTPITTYLKIDLSTDKHILPLGVHEIPQNSSIATSVSNGKCTKHNQNVQNICYYSNTRCFTPGSKIRVYKYTFYSRITFCFHLECFQRYSPFQKLWLNNATLRHLLV